MTTYHDYGSEGRIVALKGSPAEVLAMCDWHIKGGEKILLSDDDRIAIETENERSPVKLCVFSALHIIISQTATALCLMSTADLSGSGLLVWLIR